ncbi:hypothetical protein SH580_20680 [Coraliomargarita algicola]|uniref:Carbohydrate-binding domain-containing protein n=1 Tax=Coraliomargarita algicola TaxID=3092156 RepID=A0ABZ0RK93_9BACT|nr:hypothetical protein [Coraliomargarita sp. J2-16]WPJ95836.1 hypothetical protein SH580_20680 [Coraliomargarita sp. J2-16]
MPNRLKRFVSLSCGLALLLAPISAQAELLRVHTDAHDGLVVGGKSTRLNIDLDTRELDPGNYTITSERTDRFGSQHALEPITLTIESGQDEWTTSIDWAPSYYGRERYHIRLSNTESGEQLVADSVDLVNTVKLPKLSDAERMSSPIGINVGVAVHWETLSKMGIHWARDYTWYHFAERDIAPDCQSYRYIKQNADSFGIEILPVIQKTYRRPDLMYFTDQVDRIRDDYTYLSNSFPEIVYWELDNEADLKHPDTSTPEYARWFESYLNYIEAAAEGLKAAGHNAKVALNGEAGIWPDRAQQYIDLLNEDFSVVNYHFYTGPVSPEIAEKDFNTGGEKRPQTISFLDNMRRINSVAHAGGNEAWLTEIGWSAERGPAVGTLLQCAYLQRIYLLAHWANTEKVFWFWDRDLPGDGRFSDNGLLSNGQAQASGAAMAMVSKMTARAEYLGSIDLGYDNWGLVFLQPNGDYTIAAWTMSDSAPLPEALQSAKAAYGMFGNPLSMQQLSAEPAYFELESLPSAWTEHLNFEWISPTLLNVSQAGEVEIQITGAVADTLAWDQLPEGVTFSAWTFNEAGYTVATLQLPESIAQGRYPISLSSKGQSSDKVIWATLVVRQGLEIRSDAFMLNEPARVQVLSMLNQPIELSLTAESGKLSQQTIQLAPNQTAEIQFTASESSSPLELTVQLANGAVLTHTLRPAKLQIPYAAEIQIDGSLEDWSTQGQLNADHFLVNGSKGLFVQNLRAAWSEQGLYLALQMDMGDDFRFSLSPTKFWEAPGLECFVQLPGQGSHQLWFTPTRDASGNIDLYAGEWANQAAAIEITYDDDRCERAASVQGNTLVIEVLIPTTVLGDHLKGLSAIRFAANAKLAIPLSPKTLNSWPNPFGHKPEYWGTLELLPKH